MPPLLFLVLLSTAAFTSVLCVPLQPAVYGTLLLLLLPLNATCAANCFCALCRRFCALGCLRGPHPTQLADYANRPDKTKQNVCPGRALHGLGTAALYIFLEALTAQNPQAHNGQTDIG